MFHNYSFDCHEFHNEGIEIDGFACDTMHMARLWESSRIGKGSYSLESLSEELYLRKKPYKEIFGKPHIKRDGTAGKIIDVPPVVVGFTLILYEQDLQRNPATRNEWIEYSAFDAEATWHVRKELEALLRQMYWTDKVVDGKPVECSMWDFYERYYRDFGQLLVDMEKRGIHVSSRVRIERRLTCQATCRRCRRRRRRRWRRTARSSRRGRCRRAAQTCSS